MKDLSHAECILLTTEIRDAKRTKLRILSEIQQLLRKHWSKYISTTLALFLSAKSEAESYKALEAWTKLKSVLVLPLKGGDKRRRSTYKFYEKRMFQWIAGEQDLSWEETLDLEKKRTKKQNRNRSKKHLPAKEPSPRNDATKAVGGFSQAMTALLTNGTGPITKTVM